jgi:hypothetical protein
MSPGFCLRVAHLGARLALGIGGLFDGGTEGCAHFIFRLLKGVMAQGRSSGAEDVV